MSVKTFLTLSACAAVSLTFFTARRFLTIPRSLPITRRLPKTETGLFI